MKKLILNIAWIFYFQALFKEQPLLWVISLLSSMLFIIILLKAKIMTRRDWLSDPPGVTFAPATVDKEILELPLWLSQGEMKGEITQRASPNWENHVDVRLQKKGRRAEVDPGNYTYILHSFLLQMELFHFNPRDLVLRK